jgi:hypothetical protein
MERTYHVYIAHGNNAASADFKATDEKSACQKAASLWDEPLRNLRAHPSSRCGERGCDG